MFDRLLANKHYQRVQHFVSAEIWLLAAIAAASGLLLAFLSLADEVVEGETEAFDNSILMLFRDPNNVDQVVGPDWVHEMVRDITALGSFSLLGLAVVGVCAYLVMVRLKSAALLLIVSVIGGTLLSTFLKMGYNRPRPDLTAMSQQFTASFPSGHAMLSAVTFLTIGAVLARLAPYRNLKIFAIAGAVFLTLIVGFSRLYMGVHYPSDILAGWCLGAAWAMLCSAIAFKLQRTGAVETPAQQPD
ncbi:phosphatase PAP2 family protein [Devosia submarina]|uniref:phosphatase PAP2 family protein n=1 Tax=Devosia submarina TaxID=1173082 RepID=UPI000D377A74|nr:phosphatase PAP2 family protein [Devosia submarina]